MLVFLGGLIRCAMPAEESTVALEVWMWFDLQEALIAAQPRQLFREIEADFRLSFVKLCNVNLPNPICDVDQLRPQPFGTLTVEYIHQALVQAQLLVRHHVGSPVRSGTNIALKLAVHAAVVRARKSRLFIRFTP